MKCCGSQTTSTARSEVASAAINARATRGGGTNDAREVAAEFEALLLARAFAPLAKAIGFYGDTVVAAATRAIARDGNDGLADRLARAIEAHDRGGR